MSGPVFDLRSSVVRADTTEDLGVLGDRAIATNVTQRLRRIRRRLFLEAVDALLMETRFSQRRNSDDSRESCSTLESSATASSFSSEE
jgi:hypothetical protein